MLDEATYQSRYPVGVGADYVVCVGCDTYIDGVDESACTTKGRYMNHSRQPNCVCFTMEEPPRALIFTGATTVATTGALMLHRLFTQKPAAKIFPVKSRSARANQGPTP